MTFFKGGYNYFNEWLTSIILTISRGPIISGSNFTWALLVARDTEAWVMPFIFASLDSMLWTQEAQVIPVICSTRRQKSHGPRIKRIVSEEHRQPQASEPLLLPQHPPQDSGCPSPNPESSPRGFKDINVVPSQFRYRRHSHSIKAWLPALIMMGFHKLSTLPQSPHQ